MLNIGITMLGLSRFQFAMTTVFHFFFVPFSIGLAFIVAIMETVYVVNKDETYKNMAKFWGKIFLFSFAVGVVTGIIQEFQFGMNWSDYSRFMGDIFGAPLAIEALAAFFLESTFIGLWMFTWERFNKTIHCLFIWLTAFGSTLSALWILAANSFMQNPVGYAMNAAQHKVEMTSFSAVIMNRQLWNEFPHVIFGAFLTAAFVVAGCSAWRLLKKDHENFYRKSMKVSLIIGLCACLGSVWSGDTQTRYLINNQPMKFAAMEGLYKNSTDKGDWALAAGFNGPKKTWSIEIPYALNILGHHSLNGTFKGQKTVNKELKAKYNKNDQTKNYYVPTKTLFWSFRIMAISAGLFGLVAIIGLWFNRKKSQTIMRQRWFLYLMGLMVWLPFIVNTCGWFVTEFGRYPWVVYGLLTIADAVSPTSTVASLMFTNIVYFLIFASLGAVMVILSHRVLKQGPDSVLTDGYSTEPQDDAKKVDPYEMGAAHND